MPLAHAPTDAALAYAAELRAGGTTWEHVGARLHRAANTVRKWPLKYPERWRNALHDAERRTVADAEGECMMILRQLLRSTDQHLRWHAARSIIHLRLELAKIDLKSAAQQAGPNTMSDAQRLVALLESHTDEQLAQMAVDASRRTPELHSSTPDPPREGAD